MSFRRQIEPLWCLERDGLTSAMVGIGMHFTGTALPCAPIEDTLYFASVEGMDQDDLRTLSVLTTWMAVHGQWVNANRLARLVKAKGSKRVRAYWAAVAHWLRADRRFLPLERLRQKTRTDLLRTGTKFQVARKGEDARFKGSALRVPASTLRHRRSDVLEPEALARMHRTYRMRIIQGPSYRADMWARLELYPELSAAELARETYGSFETVRLVKRDFGLVSGAS